MRFQILYCVVFFIVSFILVSACNKKTEDSDALVNDEIMFGVIAKTLVPTDIQRNITVSALIRSSLTVSVVPEKEGTLKVLDVHVGDVVVKGQRLGLVDASKAGSTFLTSPIIAPVSGQVSEIFAEVGNEVSSKKLVEIIDNEKLELRIAVSEEDTSFITIGTHGTLTLSIAPEKSNNQALKDSFYVHVVSINKVFSKQSSTMHITVALTQPAAHVRSGMSGTLRLVLEERKQSIVVPKDIIVQRLIDNTFRNGVFVLNNATEGFGNVSFRPLKLGIEANQGDTKKTYVEVIKGLSVNEVVVIEGYNALADNVKARIVTIDETHPLNK